MKVQIERKPKVVSYIRISTADQKIERQVRELPTFIDVCSGSTPFAERIQGAKLLKDTTITTVQVTELDRLGRNLSDILKTIELFSSKGVNIYIETHDLNTLDKKGAPNKITAMLVGILGSIAQMERDFINERIRQGVAVRKANQGYKGRSRGSVDTDNRLQEKYRNQIKYINDSFKLGYSMNQVLKDSKDIGLKISKGTLIKLKDRGIIVQ